MIDEELRAPSEEVFERGAPFVGVEPILLVDADPRQLLPPPRQFVAVARQLLLRRQQVEPHLQPLLPRSDLMRRHIRLLSWCEPNNSVAPAQAGAQGREHGAWPPLGSRFRGNDGNRKEGFTS